MLTQTAPDSKKYDQDILKHYEAQARDHGLAPTATMLDLTVRQRETQLVLRFAELVVGYLQREAEARDGLALCDVGCGNGFTLNALRERFPGMAFHGMEFSPTMLELARSRFRAAANVTVSQADVRHLAGDGGRFDLVICQRVLINLLDPADQRKGFAELARILRPGGFLLSIEAFERPLAHLNAARAEFDLPPLPAAHHNLYLPVGFYAAEASLTPVTGPMFEPGLATDFLPSNFLSSHFFIARVLHPLALGERPFTRNSHFVRFLTEAFDRPIGDYAPIKAYAFRKGPV